MIDDNINVVYSRFRALLIKYNQQIDFIWIEIQIIFKMSTEKDKKDVKKDPKKKGQPKEQDLSVEDKELKQTIDHHAQRLLESDFKSLHQLITIVKSSTKTMTSVPKPFKFLKTHYKLLCDHFGTLTESENTKPYADFLSVLSMIFAEKGARMSLFYLLKGSQKDFTSWGHQYVSNLANDIGKEYELRLENQQPYQELLDMVEIIVPYFIQSNAQHDAIDLLLIVDKLEDIKKQVTDTNFTKIYMYLGSVCSYSMDQDELIKIVTILYDIAIELREYTIALRMAIKLDDHEKVKQVFQTCKDPLIKKQLAFNAARQKIFIPDLSQDENKIISNSYLAQFYKELAKDLQVSDPKKPKDVFKVHLEQNYRGGQEKETTLQNIYVNAFVNAGLAKDTLLIQDEEDDQKTTNEKRPFVLTLKSKEEWQTAAVASLGLLAPWNSETIDNLLMPYLDNDGDYVKAGANLGIGLCCAGINDQNDLAFGLLSESAISGSQLIRQCSKLGLGMAYAGRSKQELSQIFIPPVVDTSLPIQDSAFAALSLGLSFVGQCNEDVAGAIIQTIMQRDEQQLNSPFAKYFGIGLALLYMGQQNKCDATLQMVQTIQHPIKKFIQTMVIATAYVGSGNVLKVQQMMHEAMSDDKNSQFAIVGLALIASSQQIGNQMASRLLNQIFHFSKPQKKRMVPLAMALLSLSNAKINVIDILLKLSYDTDSEIAERAIMCLGLVGAGTNNSRLADIFRKLASYHGREPDILFCIRISQGLLYMGKGMLSIQPYYSEKFLMSKVGMAGVIIFMTALMDLKKTILGKYHYFIYYLALAMYPKSLFVLNENLEPMPLNVRVGQAVDVVGQAGRPKRITGFQTHVSPVLIGNGERAQLGTEEYIPIQDCILQNFVILKKNPDYIEEERPRKKTSM